MIGAQGLRRGGPEEEIIRLAQQGKIETILCQKEKIGLNQLFVSSKDRDNCPAPPPPSPTLLCPTPLEQPSQDPLEGFNLRSLLRPNPRILIEGAPGGGKSTLALHICHQWAQGASWLARFDVVFLAYLRDKAVQNAITLADILPAKGSYLSPGIVPQLQDSYGDNVLFVFDGWDEFPQHLMNSSLISTIIHQPYKLSLHRSTVLITSRPVSSGNLLHIADRRIEILGFTQHKIREYICKALDGNSTLTQKIVQHLEDHPVVEGYCYIPLHSAILVHIFLTMKGALPTTLHELFCSLVLCCITREQATREPAKILPELSSLDDLPDDLKTKLSKLCELAYNGVMQDKIIFYSEDLLSCHVPNNNTSFLGLLQAVEGLTLCSKFLSYNFLHLSVQELLAAYNISLMGPSGQVKVFKELFNSSRFEAVLQYYSGFTKLKHPVIQEFIYSYQQRKSHLKDLLPLLHCFYEAQQPSLCQLVDPRFDPGELNCDFLTPVDDLVVGYFITSILSTSPSRMSCVSLSYELPEHQHGLQLLLNELSKYGRLQTVGGVSRKVKLNISGISEKDAKHIASYLKQFSAIISYLRMTECDGDGGLHIVEALQTNTSLTELHLHVDPLLKPVSSGMLQNKHSKDNCLEVESELSCLPCAMVVFHSILAQGLQYNTTLVNLSLHNYNISATDPDTARSLTKMLQVNKTLTHLDLSWNYLSDSGARCIFEGLQHNTTLVNLSLQDNGITATDPDTARSLTKMLQVNKSLTHLDLSWNYLSDSGARCIFKGLQNNTTLLNLSLQGSITATDPDTARSLIKILQVNKSLTHLDLSYNRFQNQTILCIFQGLKHNTTLLHLYLRNTGITDNDAKYIGQALKSNCSLQTLDIMQNSSLGDKGNCYILVSLLFNTTLKDLHASMNSETEDDFHRARIDKGLPPIDILSWL